MKSGHRISILAVACFALGFGAATVLAKKQGADPALYKTKPPKEAAAALLQLAEQQAGDGSWERIGVARVRYLSGDKVGAQAIFDKVAPKAKKDDLERIAKIYLEAGEWEKAEPILARVVAQDPKDEDAMAFLGAQYNLHGDRAKAEELFERSFSKNSDDVWNTLSAAGSYLGVRPD